MSVQNSHVLRLIGGTAIFSAAGLAVVATAAGANAAATCPAGSTEVSAGVCSATFTSSGTFTPPAGVTTLQALLVGGGGGGYCYDYTGGAAGEVRYVSAVSTSGPVTVSVGAGGLGINVCGGPTPDGLDGGATQITDAASAVHLAAGGVHGTGTGAPGTTASAFVAAVPGTVALWPAIGGESCFAQDGADGPIAIGVLVTDPEYFGGASSVLACGAGTPSDTVVNDSAGGGAFASALANTGSGGGAYGFIEMDTTGDIYESANGAGGSGFVTFRFPKSEVFEATLAETGSDSGRLAGVSALLALLGAGAIASSRRSRRPSVR